MATLRRSLLLAAACSTALAGACARRAQGADDPRTYWLDEVRAQAAAEGVAYDSLLDRAYARDSAALARLFAVRAVDGAGADAHAQVLWALLPRWGDAAYARVLGAASVDVRARALCHIDSAAERGWGSRFPRTYAVGPHEARCRDSS